MDKKRKATRIVVGTTELTSPGVTAARRALGWSQRKPTDADRPPPSTFDGPKRRPIPGQLELGENTTNDSERSAA